MMEVYDGMLPAAQAAVSRCSGWMFAYSAETYEGESLLALAAIHDEENPADEGSFYLLSRGGAIGFCEDGEGIDWLFLPHPPLAEELPIQYTAPPPAKFCTACGTALLPAASFCGGCGKAL